MPKPCSVCSRKDDLAKINREIISGVPYSAICSAYDLAKGTLSRHKQNCLGHPASTNSARARSGKPGQHKTQGDEQPAFRSIDDPPMTGEELRKRGERMFRVAEEWMLQASRDQDLRTWMAGFDRAHKAFETLCRVAGLLGPDTVVVNVIEQQRQKANALLSELTIEELRALAANPPRIVSSTVSNTIPPPEAQKAF